MKSLRAEVLRKQISDCLHAGIGGELVEAAGYGDRQPQSGGVFFSQSSYCDIVSLSGLLLASASSPQLSLIDYSPKHSSFLLPHVTSLKSDRCAIKHQPGVTLSLLDPPPSTKPKEN